VACELLSTHLHAYLDGELDAAGLAHFERHLETCHECVPALLQEQALRHRLGQAHLYEPAPESLRTKIAARLPAAPTASGVIPRLWHWSLLTAVTLVIALLVWQSLSISRHGTPEPALVAATVDAHLRSLQPGHLTDVESTDQHTVKPWFDGKLDFAPPVRDFSSEGFPLTGGRLDVLNGRDVAALVYGRRKHIVNVFVWSVPGTGGWSGSGNQQGYNWLAWQKDGFAFCAVTDASPGDLQLLQKLFSRE
jgi:mycothiol system anti-sigma-R factor